MADLQFRLDQPFQSATYSGAGGFNGSADLKGQYKPDGVGIVRGAAGKWVDQANGWLDVCASGFHTVYGVTDGANALTADPANPPAAGKYYVDAANGRLRFGSLPTFQYRVDYRSNFASGALTIGAIAKTLLTRRAGFTAGQLDGSAFYHVFIDRPQSAGWNCPDGETSRQVLDGLLAGALAFYSTTPAKLTVGVVGATQATTKTSPTIVKVCRAGDIVPGSFKRTGGAAPPHTVNILARRNWTVLSDNQIAGAAPQSDKDFARQEYRTIPKVNATTQTEFPRSLPIDWPTPFDDLTAADSFGTTVRDLITVPRATAEVTLAIAPFGLRAGQEIWVDSPTDEVNAPAVVARISESETDRDVRLELFDLKE
jgi:hypothetical protein